MTNRQERQDKKQESTRKDHVPTFKLGLAVIYHCGANGLSDDLERKLTKLWPVIVQGKPTEISPATLYETDKHFQDWVEKRQSN